MPVTELSWKSEKKVKILQNILKKIKLIHSIYDSKKIKTF
jgi:hypothetical protein